MKIKKINSLPRNFTGIAEHSDGSLDLYDIVAIYWKNGLIHREDGPAVIYMEYWLRGWWLNGAPMTKQNWEIELNQSMICDK
jgi:hypothetical protein